jgi:hypothetical protein
MANRIVGREKRPKGDKQQSMLRKGRVVPIPIEVYES